VRRFVRSSPSGPSCPLKNKNEIYEERSDARKLKKYEGDPPTEGAGSLQQRVKKLEKCASCSCRILNCPDRIEWRE